MTERRRFSLRFVNAHYAPDVAATGEFLTDLAEGLVARGHRVHVVTGAAGYRGHGVPLPAEEVRNGVRVTRVRTPPAGTATSDRLVGYAAFLTAATPLALGGPEVDLTIYLTTPPMLGAIGMMGRLLTGRPYGLWVMDLHPEAEIAHGMLARGGPVARVLDRVDRSIFSHSRFTVVLGRCMAARVEAKTSRTPVVAPLWKDDHEVAPVPRRANPLADAWGVGDRFLMMYAGNAGLAHRFAEVMELLRHYRDDPSVLTLFIGDGPRRAELERFFIDERISNARYLDYVPRAETKWTLPLADVHLVTLEPSWCGIAVPSKVFGILAAGRPLAMVSPPDAEPARIVAEAGAGVVVDPSAPGAGRRLIEAVEGMRRDPEERARKGALGREALLARYTRSWGVERWEAALQRALAD